jgi:hypothetical protein
MKKFLLLLVLLASVATVSAQADNTWEDWQKTSCYSKISFRLKSVGKNGEQNLWKIQFRSDYPNVISFNYSVTDKLQQYNLTTHRKTLNANQQSDEIEIYTTLEDIFILVDKVSMTPYPEDFVDCYQ